MGDSELRTHLEAAVARDAGAEEFPALAELYRRAGLLTDAEQTVLRGLERAPDIHHGHVVLALVLLEQGRDLDARAVLEPVAASVLADARTDAVLAVAASHHDPLSDSEIDNAFEVAETDRDELIDPDRVAEEAVEFADAGDEDLVEDGLDDEIAPGGTFATRTMADLLERQGDADGASRIRAALGSQSAPYEPAETEAAGDGAAHDAVVRQLERWLSNLQKSRGAQA